MSSEDSRDLSQSIGEFLKSPPGEELVKETMRLRSRELLGDEEFSRYFKVQAEGVLIGGILFVVASSGPRGGLRAGASVAETDSRPVSDPTEELSP